MYSLSAQDVFDDVEELMGPAPNVVQFPGTDMAGDNVTVAIDLARRGFLVFPLHERRDGSWTGDTGWQELASRDPETVAAWWRRHFKARVGMLAGEPNGFAVLDIDMKDGKDGLAAAAALGITLESSPVRYSTPSGGWHLYFAPDPRLKNWVGKLGEGLDVRTTGGLVVAPGSFKDGRRYEPLGAPLGSVDLPPWPSGLFPPQGNHVPTEALPKGEATGEQRQWAAEIFAARVAEFEALTNEGSGRNQKLNDLAFWAGGAGAHGFLDRAYVVAELERAAEANGYAATRVARRTYKDTIARAWIQGLGKPISDFPRALDLAELAEWIAEIEDLPPLSDTLATSTNPSDWHIAAFAADGEPDLSDDQLAIDLGRAGWNRDARYCAPMGGWLLWDRHRWQPALGMKPMAIVRSYLRAKAKHLTTWAEQHAKTLADKDAEKLLSSAKAQNKILRSDPKIAAIERTTRSNPRSLVRPEQFDAGDFILGTPGGTVDLRTGVLREAQRDDYITKLTAVAPAEEGARPEAWLTYLGACFPANPEIPDFLQRLAGYALTGSTREHKAFFFHGDGRNGKGSFLNLLEWLMGDYSANVATSVLLESRNPQHSSPLAMLRGARLARGSEISGGSAWDESILKRLTGGDPITANLMRQDSITFTPKLTLIIDANRRPRIRTVDAAMKARIVLVPWRQSFAGREDRTLGDRLKAEGPAILRWAIEGAVAWHRNGFGIPASIAAASHDYLETEDDLGQFLEECVAVERGARVRATALYRRFTSWQEEQGIRAAWSQRALAGAMVERGFEQFKDRAGRGFVGLRLPDDGNLLDAPEA